LLMRKTNVVEYVAFLINLMRWLTYSIWDNSLSQEDNLLGLITRKNPPWRSWTEFLLTLSGKIVFLFPVLGKFLDSFLIIIELFWTLMRNLILKVRSFILGKNGFPSLSF
jgi:hypothetical protein